MGSKTSSDSIGKSENQSQAESLQDEAQKVMTEGVDQAKETARDVAEQAKEMAAETAKQVRQEAETRIDDQTNVAGDRLGSMAQALHGTSQDFDEQGEYLIAEYAKMAAEQVERFSHYLQEHNGEELIQDVRHLARQQPEISMALFLGAGFMIGRFLKSSRTSEQAGARNMPDARYATSRYSQSVQPTRKQAYRTQARANYATGYTSTGQRGSEGER